MKYELCSGFAGQIKNMLEHRAIIGHSVTSYQSTLANFDRFCLKNYPDKTILTKEIAFDWCNDAKGNGGHLRACVVRGFARFLILSGEESYVMPNSFFPNQKAKLPFIMNNVELENFFYATDVYPYSNNSPLLEFTVPVIFRLQYACGMRPQEVRLLRCADFDFDNNSIYINNGKHKKDRCLPLCAEVMELCIKYNRIAETIFPRRTYFFQSPTGSAYCKEWLYGVFHKCWEMSGNDTGRGYCTPYILRHNYATQTLMRWVEEGRNLDAMIPYLSAYMGHEKFSSTYYYVHLLPERLARMDFTHSDGIIPEVSDYEEDR